MPASVHLASPRALPETARTLRRLGLRISVDGALTIALTSSYLSRKVGRSDQPDPLLVPDSSSPARTLALLRKLGETASGPFLPPVRPARSTPPCLPPPASPPAIPNSAAPSTVFAPAKPPPYLSALNPHLNLNLILILI